MSIGNCISAKKYIHIYIYILIATCVGNHPAVATAPLQGGEWGKNAETQTNSSGEGIFLALRVY